MIRNTFFSASLLFAVFVLPIGCDDGSGTSTGETTTTTATGGSGGTAGTGGGGTGGTTGGTAGSGGSPVCDPGSTQTCYEGPDGTAEVGSCKSGTATCLQDGSGFGPCEGQVLPIEENCTTLEDDDCDGTANEGDAGCVCNPGEQTDCYEGPDGTVGVGLCVAGKSTCADDGKSWGSCEGQVLPTDETCLTAGDDDCDGETNEGGAACTCIPGTMSTCYSGPPSTLGKGLCTSGMQMCNDQGTGFGPCMGEVLPEPETCLTTVDDDCDGQVNESGMGCVCPPNTMVSCYTGPMGTQGVGVCKSGLALCNDQGTQLGACMNQVLPAVETCNTTVDDDCDGQVNESGAGCVCLPNSTAPCYSGPSGTEGVGICKAGTKTCNAQGTAYGGCAGEVLPAAETCASPGDENCNGQSNEGCPVTYSANVQPIFFAKCGGCHTGGGSGGHNIGVSYADTQLSSYYCPGQTKGQCALVRIQNGTMPPGGVPMVTPAEQATIQAWINGGMLP